MEKPIEKQNLSRIALKNSSYSLASTLIIKIGGLIFTILIARLLLPELFGIYSLSLSIITIAATFTALGVETTFLKYISEFLAKKDLPKVRAYFRYLFKIKSFLAFLFTLTLLVLSKFISYSIYDKPLLFYPLLFSSIYLLIESFKSFFGTVLLATKNLKSFPVLNFLEQITKISFSLLAIFLLKDNFKVPGIFLAFAFAGFVHLFLLLLISYKNNKDIFFGKVGNFNKRKVWGFFGFASFASISLVFFASIDTLMLGKFVDAEYLGYYRAALGLVLTLSSLFSLSNVLLPIFTQIHKKRFERGFQKTFKYLMTFAIPATAGLIFLSKYLIFTIYGNAYLPATFSLYFLSLLILIDPLITLYTTLFQSRDKPNLVAISVFISLIVNIFLNYILIKYLLNFGQNYILFGVGIATVISRLLLLGILSLIARSKINLKLRGIGLKKPFFATLIMSLFLLIYNKFVDINLLHGIIEVIAGALIYFGVLILIKGFTKEDLILLKSLIRK